jgi:protein subunit release factor B
LSISTARELGDTLSFEEPLQLEDYEDLRTGVLMKSTATDTSSFLCFHPSHFYLLPSYARSQPARKDATSQNLLGKALLLTQEQERKSAAERGREEERETQRERQREGQRGREAESRGKDEEKETKRRRDEERRDIREGVPEPRPF